MNKVLDATVFFSDMQLEGPLYTTPSVVMELVDIRSKGRYDALLAQGLVVREPDEKSRQEVQAAARISGDIDVISKTDLDLVALALELGACILTDDFAVQNVAAGLGIQSRSVFQRQARRMIWRFRCSGCGRYYDHGGECPVCGALIKRKLK